MNWTPEIKEQIEESIRRASERRKRAADRREALAERTGRRYGSWAMSEREIEACSLSRWTGDRDRCRWCDAPLVGRQERWSSRSCVEAFGACHWPNEAAAFAIARGSCERCGRSPWALVVAAKMYPPPRPDGPWPIVRRSWGEFDAYESDAALPAEWNRYLEAEHELRRAAAKMALEANHRIPVRGLRSSGCWNHPTNLEALCHECHRTETRLQIVSARAAGGSRTIACWEGSCEACWANHAGTVSWLPSEPPCNCPHHRGAPLDLERLRVDPAPSLFEEVS